MITKDEEGSTVLSEEQVAYEARRAELERDHSGEWVVFYGEELVGIYGDFQDAAEDALHKFGLGPYLIEQVGAPPPQVRSFLLYTLVGDNDESSA